MKTRLVTVGYAAAILLGLGWAAWAVLSAAGLEDIAGGWLGPDATVASVPPIGQLPWFGLMAAVAFYAIWQCLPQERTGLHHRLRPWVLGAVLCNALWVAFLERDRIGASLAFGLLLLALLIRIVVMVGRTAALRQVDRWITRASFGLFAGWLSVIVLAEAVAFTAHSGADAGSLMFKGACALAVLLLALFLSAVSFKNPMGIYLNAGALWVIGWIIADRYTGQSTSPGFATVLSVAAILMLLCLFSALRTRIRALRPPSQ
ncbi:hypothetical protein [Glutamicibacter sp. HZAU]|uniref:hypothetical protein n=1 Tax=Glutamicibacter sp. HZAU TaxID=2049891 RepID=UPI000FFB29F1|nr:hypothetical protein [Glutamicibacter sp. HZAU]RWZ79773.1 hypothetical protein EKH49_15660 [Glutamicibacter sp. HZAU]